MPAASAANPAQARFCLACGARLAVSCAGCGAELPSGARFCVQCGTRRVWLLDALGPEDGRVDAETQRFLDSLVESLPTSPILLAVNYRPEYRHDWGSKTYYRQARIDPLVPERADELLRALLGDDRSVESLTPLLIERTEGNPLFLEESVRTLVETQVLVGEPGAYRLTQPVAAIQMPPTVQAILAARIDRSSTPSPTRSPTAACSRTAARRSTPPSSRSSSASMLAGSPSRSKSWPIMRREVAWASRPHDTCDRRGRRPWPAPPTARAVGFFEQALSLLSDHPETAQTLAEALDTRIALGPALIALGGAGAPEVAASYQHARELVERLEDRSRLFPVLWGLWFIDYNRGRWLLGYPDRALTILKEAIQLAEDLKHPLTTVMTLWFSAWVHYQRGERQATAAAADRMLAMATEQAFHGFIETARALPLASDEEGMPELPTWTGGTVTRRQVFVVCVLAEPYAEAGRPEDGLSALASIPEDHRSVFYAPETYRLEGELLLRQSTPALGDVARCFQTAIDLARQRSERSLELRAATSLARLWQRQAKRDEARRLLAGVYEWFTEGFDTTDLRAARSLLEELS